MFRVSEDPTQAVTLWAVVAGTEAPAEPGSQQKLANFWGGGERLRALQKCQILRAPDKY